MGRNKTPTAILDAKGTFLVNPQRARLGEPSSDKPLGEPPTYLNEDQQDLWDELSLDVLPGVALRSDRTAFELLVRLTDAMRKGLLLKSSEMTTLISLCSPFAMTPADRSKVQVEAPKESKLSRFLNSQPAPSVFPATPNDTVN